MHFFKKLITTTTLAYALSLYSINAEAADSNGKFALKGAGLGTCAHYVTSRDAKKTDFFIYAGWIDGYITALNRDAPKVYDLAPWQNTELLTTMIASYCGKNPDANFTSAVDKLVQNIKKDSLSERSELIRVSYKNNNVLIYKSTLQRVRQKLVSLKIMKPASGDSFDENMALALMQIQKENNLPVNGMPDSFTLYALFNKNK